MRIPRYPVHVQYSFPTITPYRLHWDHVAIRWALTVDWKRTVQNQLKSRNRICSRYSLIVNGCDYRETRLCTHVCKCIWKSVSSVCVCMCVLCLLNTHERSIRLFLDRACQTISEMWRELFPHLFCRHFSPMFRHFLVVDNCCRAIISLYTIHNIHIICIRYNTCIIYSVIIPVGTNKSSYGSFS